MQFQNMGPFNPVNFKGSGKNQAIPIFIKELPLRIGGLAGADAYFGRVVSVLPTAPRKFINGVASGRIVRGILIADPNIMANDPGMNNLYYEGRPASVAVFGPIEISKYDLSLAAPVLGSKVLFNNTTGEIAFVGSATEVPSGYTQLDASILEIDLPNGIAIWLNYPVVAATSTALVDVANPVLTVTPSAYSGAGTEADPFAVADNAILKASCSTPGATILYTIDGSTPDMDSPVFPEEGITISGQVVVKVVAVKAGMDPSSVITKYYAEASTLDTVAAAEVTNTPAADSGTGTVADPYIIDTGSVITAASDTVGATLTYTTDGSTPTAASTAFPALGITITAGMTLKILAAKAGMNPSIATFKYQLSA